MCALPLESEIEYPTSDGQPMAETTLHRKVMADVIEGLERRYAGVPDVWVGGNLFLYYEKGNRKKCVAPDVLLVQGVRKWDRDCFFLWEEKTPELIFEITSRSTRDEDEGKNKDTYERLGVPELVLFDPFGEYLEPRLQGYRLHQGRYRRIRLNTDGSLDLRTVGLTVRPEGERLRLVDTATREKLLWNDELEAELLAAREQATREAAARREAEERAAAAEERLRALAAELALLQNPPKT
ncbi:MAG TPA: Uma2 family endonuclease [Thermoanaerobaculia bacterium]|nr:Uma2 family endonuclease [Thermoanaerobaculia bacterium]